MTVMPVNDGNLGSKRTLRLMRSMVPRIAYHGRTVRSVYRLTFRHFVSLDNKPRSNRTWYDPGPSRPATSAVVSHSTLRSRAIECVDSGRKED